MKTETWILDQLFFELHINKSFVGTLSVIVATKNNGKIRRKIAVISDNDYEYVNNNIISSLDEVWQKLVMMCQDRIKSHFIHES